jgi:hypothetical protein
MRTNSKGYLVLSVLALGLVLVGLQVYRADAQGSAAGPQASKEKGDQGKEVTMKGRIVDLHCFLTGDYPSADRAKCTADCIRAGVPAGLETTNGIFVLGQGMTGPAKTLQPLAYQQVEVRGNMFEKGNIRYIDITSVKAAPASPQG